ncbi:MAG: glycine cleavage system protein GcvH [Burkholderiales bacterium]|nr:glycine cleavage system protein GcvH [Burkholderiales bacterium]
MYSNEMKFLKSHEWVKLGDDNLALIGISQHAQALLGDIVYLELPKIGQAVTMNSTIGVIESVKAASDLYSPISGEVVEINNEAIDNPSVVNINPHDSGWLFKVKLSNPSEVEQLLSLAEYEKQI